MTPDALAILALLAGSVAIEALATRDAAPTTERPAPTPRHAPTSTDRLAAAASLATWLVTLEAARRHPAATSWTALGLALGLAGLALRGGAIRALGPTFDRPAWPPPRQRVTTWPYSWMRHPSELGWVLPLAGAAVLARSPLAATLVAALVVPASVERARREDRLAS